jgi:ornithine cyclodeaminase/alanine dehydrogenase
VSSIRVLARADIASLLPDLVDQIDLVERTYLAVAEGRVELPPKPGIHPRPNAFIHAMPTYLRDDDIAAIKWVSGYPQNAERGLPYISGVIVVNNPETGLPSALMDAAEITAARTAAASGVCIRRWARSGWRAAGVLGLGEQGKYHVRVLRELNPNVEIHAFDPNRTRVEQFEGAVRGHETPRAAVDGADVVITAGPILEDPDPLISRHWLREQCLLLPLDFNSYVRADAIEGAALFVVDDVAQFDYYRESGYFAGWPNPAGSVGDALRAGWSGDSVSCVNLGIGALDAAFAAAVLERAAHEAVGTLIEI